MIDIPTFDDLDDLSTYEEPIDFTVEADEWNS